MSEIIILILYVFIILKLFFLCVRKNVTRVNKLTILLILIYYPNSFLILSFYTNIYTLSIFFISTYLYIRIIIDINRYLRIDDTDDKTLKSLVNGKKLIIYQLTSFILQSFLLTIIVIFWISMQFIFKNITLVNNITILAVLIINGCINFTLSYLIFASCNLRIIRKDDFSRNQYIIYILLSIIPIINIILSVYLIKYASDVYEYEKNIRSDKIVIESDDCKTKYPILFLHGLCWRDCKKSNYWGRIPNQLIKHGAVIFYGYNDSTSTIENSAYEIKLRIKEILKEHHCNKINIIAHSKGGLDARYLISKLNMSKHIASLTTISTPHRGSEFSDFIYNLPKVFFKIFCFVVNTYSLFIGSKSPDIKNGIYQTTTSYCKEFNFNVKDKRCVYYQSYFSTMKYPICDIIMMIPYMIMRLKTNERIDGLSTISSAKWGRDFHIIEKDKGIRGISHADIIDLRRANIDSFNITNIYIDIVKDLKNKGY